MSFYYFLLGVLLRNSCGDFKAGILGENGFCRPWEQAVLWNSSRENEEKVTILMKKSIKFS